MARYQTRNRIPEKQKESQRPPPKKKCLPPIFPWKKCWPPSFGMSKNSSPRFFSWKKVLAPLFFAEEDSAPPFFPKKYSAPLFFAKKSRCPLFSWKYLSIHFERSLSKDCAVLGFTSLKEHEYFVQNLILWISWLTVICYKGPVNIHGEYGTGKVATAQLIIFVLQSYGATGYIESRVTGGPKKSENRRHCAIGLGLSNRKREYSEDPSKSLLVMIMHFDVRWIPLKLLH